jgi:hypothetical protein
MHAFPRRAWEREPFVALVLSLVALVPTRGKGMHAPTLRVESKLNFTSQTTNYKHKSLTNEL